MSSRGRDRGRRLLPVLFGLLLAAAGVAMMVLGFSPAPEAPLPEAPISAVEGQMPTGPSETESFTAADMAPGHLFIPAIDAVAPISDSSVRRGELSLPEDAAKLSRWANSAELDAAAGNTLIAGHVTNGQQRGALFNLAALEAGNLAYLTDENGVVHEFQLESLTGVVKADLPVEVWDTDPVAPRRLTVVTCGGPVKETSRGLQYRDNVVAVFVPVLGGGAGS